MNKEIEQAISNILKELETNKQFKHEANGNDSGRSVAIKSHCNAILNILKQIK